MLNWPETRALRRFLKDWPKAPGNLDGSFEALKVRAQDFTDEDKFVSVSCDEMSLKTRNLDTSAMVIMASGIARQNWSQAVSYFFVYGNCTGLTKKTYIFEAISKLQAIGLTPCQFVCDQGGIFVNYSKIVGVTLEHPYFLVNDVRIYFMHDSSHLLKSARNCLLSNEKKVYFNNKLVSWADVIHFYNVDSSILKCAPKLSLEHIYPNNFQRMRVNLAAQVLSRAVVAGMRTLHKSGKLDSSKALTFLNTAAYLEFYNNLFDLFNSRAESTVFVRSEEQLQFLREASKLLRTIKVTDLEGNDLTK